MIKISPSIASGPLTHLVDTLAELDQAGTDAIHFDVEDGSFVPVMNLGIKVIKELRPYSKLPFDVHLMMVNPEWIIPQLAAYGADSVSVHVEACQYPRRLLGLITSLGMRAGLAFNPVTAIPSLEFCLPYLSFIVVLSTEPEIENCRFLTPVLQKITEGKKQSGLDAIEWVVDGGVTSENIKIVIDSGATNVVVGRGIFGSGKIADNLQKLKKGMDN